MVNKVEKVEKAKVLAVLWLLQLLGGVPKSCVLLIGFVFNYFYTPLLDKELRFLLEILQDFVELVVLLG